MTSAPEWQVCRQRGNTAAVVSVRGDAATFASRVFTGFLVGRHLGLALGQRQPIPTNGTYHHFGAARVRSYGAIQRSRCVRKGYVKGKTLLAPVIMRTLCPSMSSSTCTRPKSSRRSRTASCSANGPAIIRTGLQALSFSPSCK